MTHWKIDSTKILTTSEIKSILLDLSKARKRRTVGQRQNRVIFRLATCCGLRVSEIAGLRWNDVHLGIDRPHIRLPASICKGHKARTVPLWWDAGTLADIQVWQDEVGLDRLALVVSARSLGSEGHRLDRRNLRPKFLRACACLGIERARSLTIHHGRHSFVSHALRAGRSLAEVRDAAGHANVSVTSLYTHVAVEDDGSVGSIF